MERPLCFSELRIYDRVARYDGGTPLARSGFQLHALSHRILQLSYVDDYSSVKLVTLLRWRLSISPTLQPRSYRFVRTGLKDSLMDGCPVNKKQTGPKSTQALQNSRHFLIFWASLVRPKSKSLSILRALEKYHFCRAATSAK